MSDYNDGLLPEPCLRLSYGFGQQYASVELGDGTGYVRVTDDLRSEHHKMQRWYDDELRAALDENAKLRDLCADLYAEMLTYSDAPTYNSSVWSAKLRELRVEVDW